MNTKARLYDTMRQYTNITLNLYIDMRLRQEYFSFIIFSKLGRELLYQL